MPPGTFSHKIQVYTYNGKFTIRTTEEEAGQEGVTERKTKSGKTVYERQYDFITGFIEKICYKTDEFNGEPIELLVVDLIDSDNSYCLTLNWASRKAQGILYRLPNVIADQEIKICIGASEYEFIWLQQNDKTVPLAYTKDHPNGKPQWQPMQLNGKTVYDRTKETQFLRLMIKQWNDRRSYHFTMGINPEI